ncbi:helicase domino [Caerostris extrusa]|uniref:Helicase domino n=1 Tax=Caerostris extrusa TaxID=172846 RepID=A0AAV4VYU6_CAEEX|nr:helicase domino [Caerostris extrusa]
MTPKSPISHNQLKTGVKRQLLATSPVRTTVVTVNMSDFMSHMSNVNKVIYCLSSNESQASSIIPGSPKAKRIKLEKDVASNRDLINQYVAWRKKLKPELLQYLKANRLEVSDDINIITDILTQSTPLCIGNPSLFSLALPIDSSSSQSLSCSSQSQTFRTIALPTSSQQLVNASPVILSTIAKILDSLLHLSNILQKEAYVMQKISEMRKEGLWSSKRLPKVAEGPRSKKAHWDYLLEEMVWLATDFAQERKWKKAAAKRFCL